MLLRLSVENFILIDRLDIDFNAGFTCISGETGAGKSILVGALGLLLGQRADSQVLRIKEKKCVVEGIFRIEGYSLEPIFEVADLDFEVNSIFRREITPQGKSRAFINDTPVNLSVLKEIGDRLVDIHSQNQTLELNGAAFQLDMVDSYAKLEPIRRSYHALFSEYKKLTSELEDCLLKEQKSLSEQEYFLFQLDELEKAGLAEGEQSEAESELQLLNHAEEIRLKLYSVLTLMEESDDSILPKLIEARSDLESVAKHSQQFETITERLNTLLIEFKDLTREIQHISTHVHFDPGRIEALNQRLDLIYRLEQKHKVTGVSDLLKVKEQLQSRILEMDSLEDRIKWLKEEILSLEKQMEESVAVLGLKRKEVLPVIEKEMTAVLKELGMSSARFIINIEETSEFQPTGRHKVSFQFSANRGGEVREISKGASGGELSRLMLAIKSLVIQQSMLPTILFDEIDAGISGEIAGKMGEILRRMSGTIQVIAITHLPQIAAKAQHHLLAAKEEVAGRTVSCLFELNNEQRVNEIARMLSDETITVASRAAAKELMKLY